jgi:hypothetical protein
MYLVADDNELLKEREVYEASWDRMLKEAQKIKPGIVAPVVPYRRDHVVGKHNGLDNGNVVIMD